MTRPWREGYPTTPTASPPVFTDGAAVWPREIALFVCAGYRLSLSGPNSLSGVGRRKHPRFSAPGSPGTGPRAYRSDHLCVRAGCPPALLAADTISNRKPEGNDSDLRLSGRPESAQAYLVPLPKGLTLDVRGLSAAESFDDFIGCTPEEAAQGSTQEGFRNLPGPTSRFSSRQCWIETISRYYSKPSKQSGNRTRT